MADTISVRFDDQTRERLEDESSARGIGISTFVRQLAEAELQRIRNDRIRAEAQSVTEYLAEHPTAFDDDDPSEWAIMPVEVVSLILADLVGSRVEIAHKDTSKAKSLTGVLRRIPEQGNRFAVGKRLIDVHEVKSARKLFH